MIRLKTILHTYRDGGAATNSDTVPYNRTASQIYLSIYILHSLGLLEGRRMESADKNILQQQRHCRYVRNGRESIILRIMQVRLTDSSIHSLAKDSPSRPAPSAGTKAARTEVENTFRDKTTPINVNGNMLRRSAPLIKRRCSIACEGRTHEHS